MPMTVYNYREYAIKKFGIGQTIILKTRDKDGMVTQKRKVKIIKFYPFHVLTEHRGCRECYTYWEFWRLTKDQEIKIPEPIIPDSLRMRGRGRYYG